MMGGRCAEEVFLNQSTTGAGNDIEQATELARKMVCEWGMSELGPLTYGNKEEQIFLGREISQHRDYSEETALRIDQEIRRFVNDGYTKARTLVTEKGDALTRIAEALLEREVLDAREVQMLIAGEPLPALTSTQQPPEERRETQKVLKPEMPPRLAEGDNPAHA
jgi:cell division protease FtsH